MCAALPIRVVAALILRELVGVAVARRDDLGVVGVPSLGDVLAIVPRKHTVLKHDRLASNAPKAVLADVAPVKRMRPSVGS